MFGGFLAAALLAFSPLCSLAAEESPCSGFGETGCVFVPKGASEGKGIPLLIYHRGHWSGFGEGRVAPSKRLVSSRQAFAKFALKELSEKEGVAVLATGSSDVGVTREQIGQIERAAGVVFGKVYVAAHSGGFVGLEKTLAAGPRPDRIVMLDNFYFGPGLSRSIQQAVAGGAACSGFYTRHNEARWRERFEPIVSCAVEAHDDYGHDGGVNRCLAAYLRGEPCP